MNFRINNIQQDEIKDILKPNLLEKGSYCFWIDLIESELYHCSIVDIIEIGREQTDPSIPHTQLYIQFKFVSKIVKSYPSEEQIFVFETK
jgi:hypothetical protein